LEEKDECFDSKDYKDLKCEVEGLNKLVSVEMVKNMTEIDSLVTNKLDDVVLNLTSFKTETKDKFNDNFVDIEKMKETIHDSCILKLENYIGTELLEEIVSTINLKLNSVKTEFQEEYEKMNIQLDDLNMVFINLKHKVADLENPKRGFDESDLYTCSIDETRTPIRSRSQRMPTLCETPGSEVSYSHDTDHRWSRNLDSTPKPLESADTTVIECSKDVLVDMNDQTVNLDEDESIQFVYNRKEESDTSETITKIASDVANTQEWVGTLTKDLKIYESKLASLELIVGNQTPLPRQSNEPEFSFQSLSTDSNHTHTQETWPLMSSFIINIAGIVDV